MAIQPEEVLKAILFISTFIFGILARSRFQRIRAQSLLALSFYSLLVASFLTVLEHFFWADALNLLEHFAYLANAICLFLWCFRAQLPDDVDKALP